MSDTPRTRAAILALFPDNVTGQISAQKLRDFVVSIMDSDFGNPGDFWTEPRAGALCTMSDKTIKGWIEYSQVIISDISFGRVLVMLSTGSGWVPAYASAASYVRGVLAVAGNSYVAGESQAQVLRRGLVYDSALSARFSGAIGAYLYLQSTLGSVSVTTNANSTHVMGLVELSAFGDATSGKWRFDPTWGVVA